MMYRTIMLTIAALSTTQSLSTTQASAGDLSPSVYVAPGAVHIGSAQVYVTPAPKHVEPYAAPTYDPYYAPSGHVRRAPAYYGAAPGYVAPPPYVAREPVYLPPYAVDYAPRPPAGLPYNSRCYLDPRSGRVAYCN